MKVLFEILRLDIAQTDLEDSVILRPLTTEDSENLFELILRNRPFLSPWLSWAQSDPETIDQVRSFVNACRESEARSLERHFAIDLAGVVRGVMGCAPIDRVNRTVTIGYWLDRDLWGKKIISRALRTMALRLLMSEQVQRVEVRCAVGNTRGKRAIEYAGFRFEGVLRSAQRVGESYHDLDVYALVHDDCEVEGTNLWR